MADTAPRTDPGSTSAHSLARRLMLGMMILVLAAAVVQASIAFRGALAGADELADYHMQQMALSLGSAPPVAVPGYVPQQDDRVVEYVVRIWSEDGIQVYDSTARVRLPRQVVLGFSDVQASGRTFRVFSLQAGQRVIEVAQDLGVRRERALWIAVRTVLPTLALVPLLLWMVIRVVRHSLRPVQALERQMATRPVDDLGPVSVTGLPLELRPLVVELNGLFLRLDRAMTAQRDFVADAAHELRSPLAAIRLQAQQLGRALEGAAREEAAEALLAGIDRATRLVSQMLELARLQGRSGSAVDAPMPVVADQTDPEALARAVVSDWSARAHAAEIDLGLEPTVLEPNLRGPTAALLPSVDPDLLRLALDNLVDNAVKYTPRGGRIDVQVRGGPEGIALLVQDSGPGIPLDWQTRVFDRFCRGPETAGQRVPGSGLGLAIVQAVAGRMGAKVSLGTAPGLGGLEVRLWWPAQSQREPNR